MEKMSYNLQKRLVAFFVLLGVVLMLFPCIRVYADVDISAALTTARALTDQEIEDFQQATDELIAAYQYFVGSYIGDLSTVLKSHLKFVESLGLLVLEPVEGVFYYLVDGALTIDDTNHGGGGGIHNPNHHTHGGGSGSNRRVESSDDIAMSGEDFKTVLGRLNNQYAPSQLKSYFLASYQTLDIVKKDGEKYMYFPIRYGSDMLFGQGYDELYCVPFLKDNNYAYYGSFQFHFYHAVVEDVAYFYSDIINLETGEVVSSKSCPLVYNGSAVPFIKLGIPYRSANYRYWQFYHFDSTAPFLAWSYSYAAYYTDFEAPVFYDSSDITSSNSIYNLYNMSTFTPQSDSLDDYGFFCSTTAYTWDDMYGSYIDLSRNINDTDVITYDGDTINEYIITNKSGDSTTINNYITNNYIISSDEDGGDNVNNNWNIEFPDFIASITNSISSSITSTFNLLFVPSDGFFNTKMSEVQTQITSKLPFLYDFGDIFQALFVELGENNTIYSSFDPDLTNTLAYPCWNFTINYFGKQIHLVMLDFGTFGPYLGTVRLCVFVFVYVLYIYRLWKYLPTLVGNIANLGAVGITAANSSEKGNKNDS